MPTLTDDVSIEPDGAVRQRGRTDKLHILTEFIRWKFNATLPVDVRLASEYHLGDAERLRQQASCDSILTYDSGGLQSEGLRSMSSEGSSLVPRASQLSYMTSLGSLHPLRKQASVAELEH